MEHLDLALSQQQEAVYSNNEEGSSSIMSERVSSLASGIYAEFENMIQNYGQGVLENLMPMVINVLEQLDSVYGESREQTLELEMLSEDNEQLITQYEREKQLRKLAESKYLEYEDAQDQEKRDLQAELEEAEHQVRQLESKIKTFQDHIDRSEERLAEGKREYSALHARHTEMIQSYMERMDQYQRMSASVHSLNEPPSARKSVQTEGEKADAATMHALGTSQSDSKLSQRLSGSYMYLQPSQNESKSRNDLSFEDETNQPTPKAELRKLDQSEVTPTGIESLQQNVESIDMEIEQNERAGRNENLSLSDIATSTPLRPKKKSGERVCSVDDDKIGLPVISYKEAEKYFIDDSEAKQDSSDVFLSPQAQEILRTTPELSAGPAVSLPSAHADGIEALESSKLNPLNLLSADQLMASQMSLDSTRLGRLNEERRHVSAESGQQILETEEDTENLNNVSLFAELSDQEPSYLGDINTASSFSAVGREMEKIIKENEDLLSIKGKLQTQKNDLLQRVEEISRDKEVTEEQLNELLTTKGRLKVRVTELEQELKKVKHELEKAAIASKNKNPEDRMSSANRKRFTRVEMARVLMERNQYKERLMELQEAVRWTEMIRASKENHLAALQQKKRSSVWKFFNNLFAGSSAQTPPQQRKPTNGQPINIWYGTNQPTASTHHRRNNSVVGSGPSTVEGITERQRQERRERYKHVKEHISTESRKQAYGWSLPATYNTEQEGPVAVPVPVYCRPLNTDPAMKIWCCAGICLEGGRRGDGTFMGVGKDFKEPSPSTVWIGTSTHSCSKITVLDANSPSTALDHFIVCSSHLLCMTAVPGISDQDFDLKDGVADHQQAARQARQPVSNMQAPRPTIGPRSYSYSSGAEMRSTNQPITGRKVSSQDIPLIPLIDGADASDVSGVLTGVQTEEDSFVEDDNVDGISKITSALPTMWLGAQSGKIYIHSSVVSWKKCLQSAKLKDSILSIVEVKGRVLVALADGTIAIFHRKPGGRWDLSNYHLLDLGRPHHSIRCMTVVHDYVWCGYRNKVQVIDPKTMKIEKSFDAHPRRESQVRQLACLGDGVWVSIRLDSTLRLYNAKTYHHLQDVDIEPYVSKMLGTGRYGYSFVRITGLLLSDDRLWVGTGNGVILSIPLVAARPKRGTGSAGVSPQGGSPVHTSSQMVSNGFMPYCSMVHAQLSFHGHRDSVKFFVSVPGAVSSLASAKAYTMAGARPPSPSGTGSPKPSPTASNDKNILIMSGGEGYIDFRVGDEDSDDIKGSNEISQITSRVSAAEKSHLLVWQVVQR
eukprot:gene7144-7949_t